MNELREMKRCEPSQYNYSSELLKMHSRTGIIIQLSSTGMENQNVSNSRDLRNPRKNQPKLLLINERAYSKTATVQSDDDREQMPIENSSSFRQANKTDRACKEIWVAIRPFSGLFSGTLPTLYPSFSNTSAAQCGPE